MSLFFFFNGSPFTALLRGSRRGFAWSMNWPKSMNRENRWNTVEICELYINCEGWDMLKLSSVNYDFNLSASVHQCLSKYLIKWHIFLTMFDQLCFFHLHLKSYCWSNPSPGSGSSLLLGLELSYIYGNTQTFLNVTIRSWWSTLLSIDIYSALISLFL